MNGRIGLGKIALVFFIALTFYAGHQAVCIHLDLNQNVNGYLDRAESATTAEAMAGFIDQAIEGLEERGIAEGNWSWMATDNPNTDMGVSVGQLESLRNRLLEIEKNENRGSVDYAMSLREIKESFKRISINAYDLYTKNNKSYFYSEWLVLLFFGLFWLGWVLIPVMLWDINVIRNSWICKVVGHKWSSRRSYIEDKDEYEITGWTCYRCGKEQEGKTKPS